MTWTSSVPRANQYPVIQNFRSRFFHNSPIIKSKQSSNSKDNQFRSSVRIAVLLQLIHHPPQPASPEASASSSPAPTPPPPDRVPD